MATAATCTGNIQVTCSGSTTVPTPRRSMAINKNDCENLQTTKKYEVLVAVESRQEEFSLCAAAKR